MATLQLVDDQYKGLDGEQMALHWLQAVAETKVLVCRSRVRHGFESFGQARRFRQTWALPAPWTEGVGVSLVVQRCPDCLWVIRERLTGEHGVLDWPWRWRYHRDDRYNPPKGSARITPLMATREVHRRRDEDAAARGVKNLIGELAGEAPPAAVLIAIGYAV